MGESLKTKTTFARCFVYATFFLLFCQTHAAATNSHLIGNLTAPYLAFLDDIYYKLEGGEKTSNSCKADTRKLIELAREEDINALKILDADGKVSSGILEGAVSFIGYYSECVNTVVQLKESSLKSKYCLINFNASATFHQEEIPRASWKVLTEQSKPPTIGVCVPQSCTVEDVQQAITTSLHDNFEGIDGSVSTCHGDPTGFGYDVGAIIISCCFTLILILCIVGTVRDFTIDHKREAVKSVSTTELCQKQEYKDPSLLDQCLIAFSFKTNAEKIFAVGTGENIAAIHGIKFLSMALIIFGHTFSFGTQNLFILNPGGMQQAPKNFLTQVFANGTLIVDNFFLISGFLVAYLTLKLLEKRKNFPWIYFYAHRYFRLTPLFMAVVMFGGYILRYISSGPNWFKSIEMYDDWCRWNGWLNALYLHNFIHTENMCLSHTWYLANDMQMYIVAPFILIPLFRYPKIGRGLMVFHLIAISLTTALITGLNNYPAIPYISNIVPLDVMNQYYKYVYIKPYCRMGPYIVGIGLADFILHYKELNIKRITAAFFWCLSTAAGLTVIYLMWPANKGILPTAAEAAAYSALARTVWSLCIAWLILACYYGYGGFINRILSWQFFTPLSRLTYCAYLIHPVVMNVYYGSTETPVMFSSGFVMYSFLGNLFITFVLSTFLSILFESPFVNLDKIIRKRS
ncbi:UNVERIFIED_CONTAM: nrf-6 [Trichonephila clavipes]